MQRGRRHGLVAHCCHWQCAVRQREEEERGRGCSRGLQPRDVLCCTACLAGKHWRD